MKNLLDWSACQLCPRMCGVDRTNGEKGFCGMDSRMMGARAALHMWEEPCYLAEARKINRRRIRTDEAACL